MAHHPKISLKYGEMLVIHEKWCLLGLTWLKGFKMADWVCVCVGGSSVPVPCLAAGRSQEAEIVWLSCSDTYKVNPSGEKKPPLFCCGSTPPGLSYINWCLNCTVHAKVRRMERRPPKDWSPRTTWWKRRGGILIETVLKVHLAIGDTSMIFPILQGGVNSQLTSSCYLWMFWK